MNSYVEVLDKTVNNYDKKQIPEVQFFFESEIQPGELEFLLRKKQAIKKMMEEKASSKDMDKRLEEMELLRFRGE